MTGYREDFVADFAERTFENLIKICRGIDIVKGKGFEVTQLINSFVGLLVFPQQEQYKNHKQGEGQRPNFTSYDFRNLPFPNKKIALAYDKAGTDYIDTGSDFQKMVRHLRNAVAHQELQVEPFESAEIDQIEGFRFTDTNPGNSLQSITFVLSIDDIYNILMSILYRIIDGINDGTSIHKKQNFLVEAKTLASRFFECQLDIDDVIKYIDKRR